jgi:aquaporin NIP
VNGPRLGAEAIGTFMLVFIGPGAVAVDTWKPGSVGPVGIALAFGFAILAGVYALGHVSGAHFNPAVTVGLWLSARFPARHVLPYVLAQLIGATGGASVVRAILGEATRSGATVPHVGVAAALAVEAVLTFFLVLVVLAVATDARVEGSMAGLAVGLTVAFDALMGGPLTGASMNPARSFGPALATGTWTGHWIYWVGPLVGCVVAAKAYRYLRTGEAHDSRSDARA